MGGAHDTFFNLGSRLLSTTTNSRKGRHAAIRSLAFKWIRILFRCWQDRVVYDENLYMTKLALRGSPLVPALNGAEAVNLR